MAKNFRNKRSVKKKDQFVKIKAFLTSDRLRYAVGFFLFVVAIYLLAAFVSFLFHGDGDQSVLGSSWIELLRNDDVRVMNKAGKTGAFLSEYFINRGFGVGSFLFVYLLTAMAFRLWGRPFVKLWKAALYSLLLVLWISLTLGFVVVTFGLTERFAFLGGANGLVLTIWFNSMFGSVGTFFIIAFSLFLMLLVRFRRFTLWLAAVSAPKQKSRSILSLDDDDLGDTSVAPVETIGKVINENGQVVADFDPDTDADFSGGNGSSHQTGDMDTFTVTRKQDKETPLDMDVTTGVTEETDENFISGENLEAYDPTLDLSAYKFPAIDLLDDHNSGNAEVSNEELLENKNKIVETLRHYKIEISKIKATIGPTITLYEIIPAPGIRIARIKNLEDDIALSLSALGIRIIAPIPGKGTIGIEVPNKQPEVVSMRSIISSRKFQESTADLPVVLGKTISNEAFMIDLTKMPHILVAGATGQGKSVGLNALITSLLYKKHPSQLKFVMIDPKKVELNLYSIIEKHFLAKLPDDEEPIITDIQKVKYTLSSLNVEMDIRYELLKKAHARNVKEYNTKFVARRLNPEKGHRYLPYIVVIVDEFADLIMTAGRDIELPIARVAQLARAVGIHMVIATQRPSTNIITGVIKANFPARIAFKVASMIDSRTILDTPGANQLIGKGDMLISMGSVMTRLQCAFVDTPEVERICQYISSQQGYPSAFMLPEYVGDQEGGPMSVDLNDRDELFEEAARIVVINQSGSTSLIQRKLSLGYNRAGRIMDQLEAAGVVGPSEGSKARHVLIQDEYHLEQLLNSI